MSKTSDQPSIVDDFMYGSNVATAHVSVRLGFLRKVYGIISVQILVTVKLALSLYLSEDYIFWIAKSSHALMFYFIGTFVTMIVLMIKRRETPINYLLLALFTVLESFIIGTIVIKYNVPSVIEAFALTFAVTFGLTIYTLQSKRDFNSWKAGMFACLWVLLLVIMMQILVPQEMMERIITAGAAVLFSLFIVFDTHMMMHKLSPEEYVLAAVNMYLDILNLFVPCGYVAEKIGRLCSGKDSEKEEVKPVSERKCVLSNGSTVHAGQEPISKAPLPDTPPPPYQRNAYQT